MDPTKNYREIADRYRNLADSTKKALNYSSLLRLAIFGLTSALAWYTFETGFGWVPVLLGFIVFLFLVRRHLKLKHTRDRVIRVLNYAEHELKIFESANPTFEGGEEYVDPDHPFTFDLGVFGKGSLFGFLNRTKSRAGADNLAGKLIEIEVSPEAILAEREIIRSYSDSPEFVFKYLAGIEAAFEEEKEEVNGRPELKPHPSWTYALTTRILPLIMLGATVAFALGYLSFSSYTLWLLLAAIPVGLMLRKHTADFTAYDSILKSAKAYEEGLALVLEREVESSVLAEWFNKSRIEKSSVAIKKLERIKESIDARNNIFVGVVLNLILLWDFQNHRRLYIWHDEWLKSFFEWKKLVHEIEAYLSLSIYVHNHPDFVFPEFVDGGVFEFQDIRHVTLGENAVPNSLKIRQDNRLVIITGANMAGKSTFLRTVGTNMVLAMRGLPVPAGSFRFTPTQLFTSMLTSDSLSEGESYFFSELSRLKKMVEILESGTALFVILDEILKGTNSIDKAEGSKLFVEKLLELPAKGLIATHDLSLCAMEDHHRDKIENRSFEVEFHNDELHFDYTLRAGVCKNMNARFLLQKMGLIPD